MTIANERSIGGRLRRLLVCFDGSPESKEAIELALDLGKALDAELTIFSVLADTSHLETTEARHAAERSAGERLDVHLTGIRLRAAAREREARRGESRRGRPSRSNCGLRRRARL